MGDSRVFSKSEGITVEGIGRSVRNFLQNSRDLTTQESRAGQGRYVVQAMADEGWMSIGGADTALEVQISDIGSGFLVNIGNARWVENLGAGLGGYAFGPLAVTAIAGSVQQKKLPGEIFSHIELYIANGGRDVYLGMDMTAAAPPSPGMIVCPRCRTEAPYGQSFCNTCGSPMTKACPRCGIGVPLGNMFCPNCGSNMNDDLRCVCPSCGIENLPSAVFCYKCGARFPEQGAAPVITAGLGGRGIKCVKCGALNDADDAFCCECGEKLIDPNAPIVCPSCGAQIAPTKKFCPKCGNKLAEAEKEEPLSDEEKSEEKLAEEKE